MYTTNKNICNLNFGIGYYKLNARIPYQNLNRIKVNFNEIKNQTITKKEKKISKIKCEGEGGLANNGNESVLKENIINYEHVLLAIADANPYLSEGSRQALVTTAHLTNTYKSKLTVLVIDGPGEQSKDAKFQTLSKELGDYGCSNFEMLSKEVETKSSVVLGDVADEINADLIVLSSDAVHAKAVDANLLAEFVSCPVLMIP